MSTERTYPVAQSEIEAAWQLNDICDMRCRYCFSTRNRPDLARAVADPERCLDFFNGTGKAWSLHLTGGEPFLSSGFVELCKVLSRNHLLSLNSNLSSPLVRTFAAEVDPLRVEYIHCCVHLEERGRLNKWRGLEDNLRDLARNGFLVFASQAMTSGAFSAFPRAADRLANLGIVLIPKALQGSFEGKWYPHSYTPKERALFRAFSIEAERSMAVLAPGLLQLNPTVNPLRDREFLTGFPIFRGVTCAAGTRFFTIHPNGNIYRCGCHRLLGNIEEGWFTPMLPGAMCDTSYYPYVCLRYSELMQNARKTSSIPLEVAPAAPLQVLHSALRTGRKMLRQRIS